MRRFFDDDPINEQQPALDRRMMAVFVLLLIIGAGVVLVSEVRPDLLQALF
jgi:hypothetical protein